MISNQPRRYLLIKNKLIQKKFNVPIVGDFHFNGHKLLDSVPDCAVALR